MSEPIEQIQKNKKVHAARLELLRQQAREAEQLEKIEGLKIDLHMADAGLAPIRECIARAQKVVDGQ